MKDTDNNNLAELKSRIENTLRQHEADHKGRHWRIAEMFYDALRANQVDRVETILEAVPDVIAYSYHGSGRYEDPMWNALGPGDRLPLVKLLKKHGVEITGRAGAGAAAFDGSTEVLEYFLNEGLNPNTRWEDAE